MYCCCFHRDAIYFRESLDIQEFFLSDMEIALL
jgi:hypothetical protein